MDLKDILMPLPSRDFDPSESAIPWQILLKAGRRIVFATPNGKRSQCDLRMLDGRGLGPLASLLAAQPVAREAYAAMEKSSEFNSPLSWESINVDDFAGIILPGGHAKGMKEYLESPILQNRVSQFFERQWPVAAICHGVVLAARSPVTTRPLPFKSVLWGRKTTSLLAYQELSAWALTCLWLKDYYRTYPITVEAEVKSVLKQSENDFIKGPLALTRDSLNDLSAGFVVRDQNYLSARWPGDAHRLAFSFLEILNDSNR